MLALSRIPAAHAKWKKENKIKLPVGSSKRRRPSYGTVTEYRKKK